MKIINRTPLSTPEAKSYIEDFEDNKELKAYFKKFGKLSKEKIKGIRGDVQALDNPKINEEKIIKIIDFQPKTSEEVHKIFTDISLNEDEAKKIIEVIRKY